jgi:HAD superfamily hydrolase (TIGR01549 family)
MLKHYIANKKAVFFDLDNTLVDTQKYWVEAVENVAKTIPNAYLDLDTYYKPGQAIKVLWADLDKVYELHLGDKILELTNQTYEEFKKIIADKELKETDGFWELAYYFKAEKKFKLALATGTRRDIADMILSKIEATTVFDFIGTGDDVKRPKPAPDLFLYCAKNLNVKPKEVLVFDDSIYGAQAALKAGMDIIVVWDEKIDKYDYPADVLDFIGDFLYLPEALDKDAMEEIQAHAKKMAEYEKLQKEAETTATPESTASR